MNQYRRKLLHAILFFAKTVKRLNTTKLSKLLYFFDFTHVKQTGYPAIGLQYHAFDYGPIPGDFWREIKDGTVPDDFRGKLAITVHHDECNTEHKELNFRAKTNPDMGVFTPREQKILKDLAYIYKEATAKDMSEISHFKNGPWDQTYRQKGRNAPIDYQLALDADIECEPDEAKERLREHFEVVKNFALSPTT